MGKYILDTIIAIPRNFLNSIRFVVNFIMFFYPATKEVFPFKLVIIVKITRVTFININ